MSRCGAMRDPCHGLPGLGDTERAPEKGRTAMAMGNRPEVPTAAAPVVALDVALGIEQMATALARVPFRHPFAGPSSPLSNLGMSVTREVIRAFMGYASVAADPRVPLARAPSRRHLQGRHAAVRQFPRRVVSSNRTRWRTGDPLPPPAATAARGNPLPPRWRLHRDFTRPCTPSSRRGSARRPSARSSWPTTGWRRSSRIRRR